MRLLTFDAMDSATSGDDVFDAADAPIAAVTSISPADACTVAAKHALRYAVQCWDAPTAGKAIFWKPFVAMQGLYRTEFQALDTRGAEPSGLLRVTFSWSGRSLHVLCAQLAAVPEEAEWQSVQVARELSATHGPTVLAIEAGGTTLPPWPGYVDAWPAAHVRSIWYSGATDIGDVVRAAFGVGAANRNAAPAGTEPARGAMRLFVTDDLTVLRSAYRPNPQRPSSGGALLVDLAAYAPDGDEAESAAVRARPSYRSPAHVGTIGR